MKRFDLTTPEGNEVRLNHGDSERVRLKEEGMNEWNYNCGYNRGRQDAEYHLAYNPNQDRCPYDEDFQRGYEQGYKSGESAYKKGSHDH